MEVSNLGALARTELGFTSIGLPHSIRGRIRFDPVVVAIPRFSWFVSTGYRE